VVRLTGAVAAERQAAARQATGAAVLIGIAAATVLLSAALVTGPSSRLLLAVMAVSLPGLLAQDAYRHVMFAAGRPQAAALNDLVWFSTQAAAAALLLWTDHAGATELVAAFGFAALVAAVVASRQTGVVPRPSSAWQWLRSHRDLGIPFALEILTVAGTLQLALVGVAAIAGVVAIGELRAGMLLLAPLGVVFSGLFLVAVPEGVRLRERPGSGFITFVAGLGMAMPVATLLWAAALLLVPDRVGIEVLGTNWAAARDLLLPVAALTAGTACALAAVIGLRAMGAARKSLGARLWGSPVTLVGGLVGASVAGAFGAAVGLAIAAWVDAAIAWAALRRVLSRHPPPAEASDGADDPPLVL
jgi:hypothetical protein